MNCASLYFTFQNTDIHPRINTALSRINFSGYVGHVTMLNLVDAYNILYVNIYHVKRSSNSLYRIIALNKLS